MCVACQPCGAQGFRTNREGEDRMASSSLFETYRGRLGRRTFVVALALAALVFALSGAPAARAGLQKEFSIFANCPVNTPGVTGCVSSETTSGEFKIGSNTVPVTAPIIISGGI